MKSIVIALPQPEHDEPQLEPPYYTEPHSSRFALFLRRYGMVVLFTALLLAGMVFGAVRAAPLGESALNGVDRFLLTLPGSSAQRAPLTVFADSFCVSFLFLFALCFFSLSPFGAALIPAVVFFRGYEHGLMCGVLCAEYEFAGLAYYISVVLAGAFLSSLALVYLSQYGVVFSGSMLLAIFDNISFGGRTLRARSRELIMNAAYSLIVTACASLADTALYFLIGRFFALS